MKFRQISAVTRLNMHLQLAEPSVQIIMILIPIVMAPFMLPAAKAQLLVQGYHAANGSEQVVPGLAVLFSFFSVQLIIQNFFNEATYNTWDRLQVSITSLPEIITGKAIIAYIIQLLQLIAVVLLSSVLFNFSPNGSWLALAVTLIIFSACLTFFGILLVSWTDSASFALMLSNFLGVLMAGLGGSLSPTNSFPDWAQKLAWFDPAYWALSAIKKISLDHGNLSMIKTNLIILIIITSLFVLLALLGFKLKPLKAGDH
ncbi:ABC transporter permease [Liquorilactobacillus satsumensis]|uniref:ABC transporter permease n=1 Tax=Liquorilactobacillus satsumensis TaxID=259059 RepID=UPI001E4D3B8A|nr:ABC transporter permease [Liquorilactobacillus satsumensis]MCC7666258.1 multidrug ABC transporter permease [Liquorilactobacillus satsumensis]MCP9358066.1 ABC transporter permease [Liquorilactobacillus satsumensis]MCP9372031.1 ABC transporter permease [Liquorilactobacillus satsumensis]